MNSQQQIVEGEMTIRKNHDFSVQHKLEPGQLTQCCNQFGEIAVKRLASLGLKQDLVALAKCQAAKAVPFRLVKPAWVLRDFRNRTGLRWGIGWFDG